MKRFFQWRVERFGNLCAITHPGQLLSISDWLSSCHIHFVVSAINRYLAVAPGQDATVSQMPQHWLCKQNLCFEQIQTQRQRPPSSPPFSRAFRKHTSTHSWWRCSLKVSCCSDTPCWFLSLLGRWQSWVWLPDWQRCFQQEQQWWHWVYETILWSNMVTHPSSVCCPLGQSKQCNVRCTAG